MKIVLCNRDPRSHVGGDATQVYGYIKALQKLGHEAEYCWALDFDAKRFNEAWLFHINFGWTVRQWRSVQQAGIPYRVFAIYYSRTYSDTTQDTMGEIMLGAKAVYCLSPKEAEELREEFPEINPIIIDNGVDKDIFRPDGFKRDEGRIMMAGRYQQDKGHLRVIESGIRLKLPVIVAGSLGDNSYKQSCLNTAMTPETTVDVLDNLDPTTLADYYRGAKVFICASEGERNNLTVLEAAACGTTVIDSIFNRAASIHPFKVVDPFNKEEMDAAILEAYNNPIDYSSQVKSWDDVIQDILK